MIHAPARPFIARIVTTSMPPSGGEEMAMLEGITRIPPVAVETLPDDLRETLEEQRKLRGEPLYPYLFYARHPAYFRAAKAMWAALGHEAERVPVALRALVNRRVAWWNGCEF